MTKANHETGMSNEEKRAAMSLAGIYALRMLGLFLILPVFALYAKQLQGVTPVLVGLAIGAYGLTQSLLQIPFGMISDRIGRKPVIVAGLIMFAAGSVVAALADSIWGVIAGRALQGSGAIAGAVMALAADVTREDQRTKAMAMIGMSIGASFMVAIVLGPVLNEWIGVPGIFWLTAILSGVGIAVVLFWVPQPKASHFHRDTELATDLFGRVLKDIELLRLNFGILILHMIISSVFLAVPLALHDEAQMASADMWEFYLPVMLLSVAFMIPFVIQAEKHRRMKPVFVGAILVLALALAGMYFFHHTVASLGVLLVIFFTAFNLLEAVLPSLVSKVAAADSKGTAMGIYATSQFTGAFLGGMTGGWIHGQFGLAAVFLFGAGMVLLWFLVAVGMAPPRYLNNRILDVGELNAEKAQALTSALLAVAGVVEAVVVGDEGFAYLKVDPEILDQASLEQLLRA